MTAALVAAPVSAAAPAHPYPIGGPGDWTPGDPLADADAIVTFGPRIRVTVLTSRMLRLEFAAEADGAFQDAQTTTVWNRRLHVPPFTAANASGAPFIVDTGDLRLTYSFTSEEEEPDHFICVLRNVGTV